MIGNPGGRQRSASFRGVPFFTRRAGRSGPRALQLDEYPASDRWSVIDLGRRAPVYRVEAYVADEVDVERRRDALQAALDASGPGLLILPQHRPVMAWCRVPDDSWESNKLGQIEFRLEFVEDGGPETALPGLGLAERMLVEAMDAVAGFAGTALATLESQLGDVRGLARFEASAFSVEALARQTTFKAAALALTADDATVAAIQTATGYGGFAAVADAVSVIGGSGLDLLEEVASS